MYVALVCPYDLRRPGGVKSHIFGLARALVERGHRVDVIAPSPSGEIDTIATVECGRAIAFRFSGTQIDLTWSPWSQVRAVANRGYDVMHFHTMWNPLFPFQLASMYRGPKVATFHDVPGVDTPAIAARLMGPTSEMLRRTWLNGVIAVSPSVGAYLSESRYTIIPNGITRPAILPPEGDRAAILYLGRLEPRKDVATLIRAMAALGPSAPPLWIAGDGPLRAELESLANSLGVRDVTFFGEVDECMKWQLLRGALALVAPSIAGESFGIVLLEALAGGAIPIAADNPGYSGVLADRGTDLLYTGGNSGELARCIATIIGDAHLQRSLRAWGETRWVENDWRRLVDRVQSVYVQAQSQ